MRKSAIIFLFLFIGVTSAVSIQAQTPTATPAAAASGMADVGIKANLAGGEVTAVSTADNKITLQTKDGAIDVMLVAATTFKRIPPENPKLSAALDAAVADIGVGDKILVTGAVSADKKSIPAKAVYLMTKADISKRLTNEQNAWRTRGVTGRVVSLNPNTQEFTIASRGLAGEQNVIVKPKSGIKYQRYAPNSVKFDDAKASAFTELRIGDQIRALGDKSADGVSFDAERVLSGAFKTVGGTITAIDPAKNEITIKELQTNKIVTIALNETSSLKKFPAEMANMMAMRMMGGAGGGMQPPGAAGAPGGNMMIVRPPAGSTPPASGSATPGQTGQEQNRPAGAQGGGQQTFRMGAGGAGRADIEDLFERFPATSLAELKVGDAIAVSSSSDNPARLTAIKLISGVEPFFRVPQIAAGMQRGNQGGGQNTFNIPGLDGGFGNP